MPIGLCIRTIHSVGFGIAYPRLEGVPEPDLRDER